MPGDKPASPNRDLAERVRTREVPPKRIQNRRQTVAPPAARRRSILSTGSDHERPGRARAVQGQRPGAHPPARPRGSSRLPAARAHGAAHASRTAPRRLRDMGAVGRPVRAQPRVREDSRDGRQRKRTHEPQASRRFVGPNAQPAGSSLRMPERAVVAISASVGPRTPLPINGNAARWIHSRASLTGSNPWATARALECGRLISRHLPCTPCPHVLIPSFPRASIHRLACWRRGMQRPVRRVDRGGRRRRVACL